MSKKILRKKLLLYRNRKFKLLGANYNLLVKVLKKFDLHKNKKIGAYYPIKSEIDCFEILKKLEKLKHQISLPVIRKNNKMDFFQWSFNEPLRVGKMGVPEPFQNKKINPDVLLVPLIAFDKYNYRLGYGGGYYDRYIEKLSNLKNVLTVGIAFSFQKVNKLPTNNHDKKLDLILTENFIF